LAAKEFYKSCKTFLHVTTATYFVRCIWVVVKS